MLLAPADTIFAQQDTKPANIAAAGSVQNMDSAEYASKIEALLSQMTVEEKIGQMVQFTYNGTITGPSGVRQDLEEQIKKGHCGSVFNAYTVSDIRKLQKLAVENSRLKIPIIFGYDVIHGYKTIFPIPLGEAASWDLGAIEKSARIAAIESSASGLNWTFAPMVDISRDPRWGRVAEGAGEDPYLGSEIAKARVQGFQGDLTGNSNVIACVKHFAAYGAVQAGRDYSTVDMSERALRETYLPPYKAAVDAGALTVMTSFNELNGIPATANRFLLQNILRDEWGFKGFVVTDYTAINELVKHGIAADTHDAGKQALDAGVDMDMQGGVYFEHLKTMLDRGEIAQSQIDDAVRRILLCKFKLGLFDDPYRFCNEEREAKLVRAPEHLQASYDVASESIVLLKNRAQTLPLQSGARVAVIGPLATAGPDLLGCWNGRGEDTTVTPILDTMKKELGNDHVSFAKGCDVDSQDRSHFAEAVSAVQKSDVALLILGEGADLSGEANCRTSINLPGVQTELIREIKKTGKPIVLVLLNGRPLALEEESLLADALVEAWHPGSEGARAVVDILTGKRNPSAKLPITFPRNLGQVPIYYSMKNTGRPFDPVSPKEKYKSTYLDCPNDPLYPFGFGLSYSKFEYSNLRLDKNTLQAGEKLSVSIELVNTSNRDGAEIVQLYIRDKVGSVTRPVLELKDFQKIALKAGEKRTIHFTITEKDLAFLRRDMTWGAEPGEFEVFVGPNSRDLQSAPFKLVTPKQHQEARGSVQRPG